MDSKKDEVIKELVDRLHKSDLENALFRGEMKGKLDQILDKMVSLAEGLSKSNAEWKSAKQDLSNEISKTNEDIKKVTFWVIVSVIIGTTALVLVTNGEIIEYLSIIAKSVN